MHRALRLIGLFIFLILWSNQASSQAWIDVVICNDNVSVALDNNCSHTILPDEILEGGPYGPDNLYSVEIDKSPGAPDCNGPWLPPSLGFNDIGQSYCVRVTYLPNGNKCFGYLQVTDNLPPILQCPANLTVGFDPNACTHTAVNGEFDLLSVTDNCYTPTVMYLLQGATAGSGNGLTINGFLFNPGTTLVRWKATDGLVNSATCTFQVTVEDNTPPAITCPGDMTRSTDPGQCTYTTTGTEFDPASVDVNCSAGLFYSLSDANNSTGNNTLSGFAFPAGPTTVTWVLLENYTFTLVNCSFNVTVNDNEAPAISCPASQNRNAAPMCSYAAIGAEFDPLSATDNCPATTLGFSLSTGGTGTGTLAGIVFPLGQTTVTWTVTDGSNNSQSCSFTVDVSTNAAEVCNGLDDDCDGLIDEGVQFTFYADADGDGYGDVQSTTLGCTPPQGYVANATDCDDTNPAIHPGAQEICTNNIDDDCDGQIDETRHPDYDALMAIYASTGGAGWNIKSGWSSGALGVNCNVCTWYGVNCNSAGRVRTLVLWNNNLVGTIPPEIGDLSSLTNLELRSNHLYGSLPPEFGQLTNLIELALDRNHLSGAIPPELGDLVNLRGLYLYNNQLTGSIPARMGDMVNLQRLGLDNNKLSGSIPPELGNLPQLMYLNLSRNQLSGCLPGTLTNLCPNAAGVTLSNNPNLPGGGSPAAWQQFCANGTGGDADGDGYCKGTSPASDCQDSNPAIHPGALELCNGVDDNCNGQVDETSAMPDFQALMDLYNATNGANWTVTMGWAAGAAGANCNYCSWHGVLCNGSGRVISLGLSANNLAGNLPATIDKLSELQYLVLDANLLTGSIPTSIGNLKNLKTLELNNNQLSGPIPATIGGCTALTQFFVSQNNLAGSIPGSLASLSNLYAIIADHNQLSGNIPAFLGNMPGLGYLVLNHNQLGGNIPTTLGSQPGLNTLLLNNNQLSGCLPPSLTAFCNRTIDLSANTGLPGGGSGVAWSNFCLSGLGGDADGDGYCKGAGGVSDCNDANPAIHPGAPELCNGLDDNCNGQVDENIITGFTATVTVSCNNPGGNKITVSNVIGGTPPYAYSLNGINGNYQSSPIFNNLSAGTYQVAVKQTTGPGCPIAKPVTIHPPMTLTTTVTHVSCNGGANGTASVSVSGGSPNYVYLWRRGTTFVGNTATVTGLIAGNYRVNVRDNNGAGCVVSSSIVTVTQPPLLSINLTVQKNVSCKGGNDGALTVAGAGGAPAYTYAWSNFGTTATIANLTAGAYTCTVTDTKGCTQVRSFTITQPAMVLALSAAVTTIPGNLRKVVLSASGGTPPYLYRIVPPGGSFVTSNTFIVSPGTFVFETIDSKGCLKSISYLVSVVDDPDDRTKPADGGIQADRGTPGIRVFPNPNAGGTFVFVGLENMSTTQAEFRITDALGRDVFREHLPVKPNTPVRLPIPELPAGTYFVAVVPDDGRVYTTTLLVSKD